MAHEPKNLEVITLQHVRESAAKIVEMNRRLYDKYRSVNNYRSANEQRTTCMDNLEGLKTLMIQALLHETDTYRELTDTWSDVLHWP